MSLKKKEKEKKELKYLWFQFLSQMSYNYQFHIIAS